MGATQRRGKLVLGAASLVAALSVLRAPAADGAEEHYSQKAMEEFRRDMIANLNGMYEVLTIDPELIAGE
ncbi:MAG: hypothetical protein HYU52_05180 [Acidobacteria bacterium]|nr:hypothetical protein [Acidobacteriota bacterium]